MQSMPIGGGAPGMPGIVPEINYSNESSSLAVRGVKTAREWPARNQSTFDKTNNILYFDIGSKEFLVFDEARLTWDFKNTSGVTADLDGGSNSAINRLQVFSDEEVLLEQLLDYNLWSVVEQQYHDDPRRIRECAINEGSITNNDDPHLRSLEFGQGLVAAGNSITDTATGDGALTAFALSNIVVNDADDLIVFNNNQICVSAASPSTEYQYSIATTGTPAVTTVTFGSPVTNTQVLLFMEKNDNSAIGTGVDIQSYPRPWMGSYRPDEAIPLDNNVTRHFEFPLRAAWFRPHSGKLHTPMTKFKLQLDLAQPNEFMVDRNAAAMWYDNVTVAINASNSVTDPCVFTVADAQQFVTNTPVKLKLRQGKTLPTLNISGGSTLNQSTVESTVWYVQELGSNSQNEGLLQDRRRAFTLRNLGSGSTTANDLECTANFGSDLFLVYPASQATLSYEITNAIWKCPGVRIENDAFNAAVISMLQGERSWTGTTTDRFTNTVQSSAGPHQSWQIMDKSSNVEAFVHLIRANSSLNSPNRYSLSQRSIQYVSQAHMELGGIRYPATQFDIVTNAGSPTIIRDAVAGQSINNLNISEVYSEITRVFGRGRGCINYQNFAQVETNNGAGLLAFSMQSFDHAGRKLSGMNTRDMGGVPTLLYLSTQKGREFANNTSGVFGDDSENGLLVTFARKTIEFRMSQGRLEASK